MDASKPNRRVRYTQMVLRQSLLELMEYEPINKIRVTDICTKAELNRGTFYAYYTDPYDLLGKIEQELYDKVKDSTEKILNQKTASTTREIFDQIAENSDLCKVLFSDYGDKEFLNKIMMIHHDRRIEEWRASAKDAKDMEFEWLYAFTINGSIGIIQKWIQDGMKETSAEIAEVVKRFNNYGLRALIR